MIRNIQLAGNEIGSEKATRIPATEKLIITMVEIKKRKLTEYRGALNKYCLAAGILRQLRAMANPMPK